MINGVLHISMFLIPAAGAPVKLGNQFRLQAGQLAAQQVREKLVIAVPVTFLIQGNDEQIGGLQTRQDAAAVRPPRESVAQRTAEASQDGGVQQDGRDGRRLLRELVVCQVIQNVPVASREIGDDRLQVFLLLQR